jgi:hypothetical protein
MNSNNNSITNNRRIVVTTWDSLTNYDDLGLVTLWVDEDDDNANSTNSSTSMILKQMSSIDADNIVVPALETRKS